MGIRNFTVLAAVSVGFLATPAHAQDGAMRTYTMDGSWSLDAGDDYCRLAATFADGEDSVAFALERNRAENFARLILVGESLSTFRGAQTLGYSFQPANDARMAMFSRSETPGGLQYFNLGLVSFEAVPEGPPEMPFPPYSRAAELQFAAGVRAIEIDEGLRQPIRIETGSMRAPIQALQACTDDLLLVWGLDFEKHQTMTRRAAPIGPAYEWVPGSTFGFQDFALLGGGNNVVRVMVDAAGKPTTCAVHWASLDERKNAAICEGIMKNGEFEPALDADGNAMASYWMVDPIFGLTKPFGR